MLPPVPENVPLVAVIEIPGEMKTVILRLHVAAVRFGPAAPAVAATSRQASSNNAASPAMRTRMLLLLFFLHAPRIHGASAERTETESVGLTMSELPSPSGF
jgi:hypothetical protein